MDNLLRALDRGGLEDDLVEAVGLLGDRPLDGPRLTSSRQGHPAQWRLPAGGVGQVPASHLTRGLARPRKVIPGGLEGCKKLGGVVRGGQRLEFDARKSSGTGRFRVRVPGTRHDGKQGHPHEGDSVEHGAFHGRSISRSGAPGDQKKGGFGMGCRPALGALEATAGVRLGRL